MHSTCKSKWIRKSDQLSPWLESWRRTQHLLCGCALCLRDSSWNLSRESPINEQQAEWKYFTKFVTNIDKPCAAHWCIKRVLIQSTTYLMLSEKGQWILNPDLILKIALDPEKTISSDKWNFATSEKKNNIMLILRTLSAEWGQLLRWPCQERLQ